MKELSLFEIRDMALDSGRAVFSVQQLSNLLGKPRAVCRVYAFRLVKKGLAWKVAKGVVSFEKDEFIVATQLFEPSYVSLGSAMLFHGLVTQVQRDIECVSPKNSLKLKRLGIVYHRIPSSFFYGFKKHAKGKSYVFVAEPEKAVLDGLYLGLFSEKDFVELSKKMDLKRIRFFLKKFVGHGQKKLWKVVSID